jgi:hypothetical protein
VLVCGTLIYRQGEDAEAKAEAEQDQQTALEAGSAADLVAPLSSGNCLEMLPVQ